MWKKRSRKRNRVSDEVAQTPMNTGLTNGQRHVFYLTILPIFYGNSQKI